MQEGLTGAGIVCAYFIVAASLAMGCRFFCRIPDELFRKILHFILLISYIPFVFAFDTWWMSALFAVVLELAVYPILAWFERFSRFSSFVTERKKGEFKSSLLLAFTMLAVCMAVCWGWLGDRYLVLACMYAWGIGDAFAALVGTSFGRHKIYLPHIGSRKSVEGTLAMFVSSSASILTVLLMRGGVSTAGYLLIPVVGGMVVTLVELLTPGGMDTVTCPTAAMVVILPLVGVFGGVL